MKKFLLLCATALMTLGVAKAETYTYAIAVDETHNAGEQVTLKNGDNTLATLTFGVAGGAAFKAGKGDNKLSDLGFSAYTEGNGENGKENEGTVYAIAPTVNATITVGVVLNGGKPFFITEDGTALEGYNGMTEDDKVYKAYTFSATAGKTYKVYCTGSKLGFYGFNMEVGGTTGIEAIEATRTATERYDLTGRRASGKGLMIEGGKVILVK